MSVNILPIEKFLEQRRVRNAVLFDTRSEKEFEKACIPGAVSLPLLNNEHRHIIGTIYKEKGREAAILKGFELVGPLFHEKLKIVRDLAGDKEVFLYCWRGGMRSNIMAWLIRMMGIKVTLLEKGYKSYRNWVLNQFQQPFKILILGGMTGSGKTEVLQKLNALKEQTIDLEHLACHKGSAFGLLGMPEQPRQEFFENMLAEKLAFIDHNEFLWLENESRNIGQITIPEGLFSQMRCAKVIEMEVSIEERSHRILSEYGIFPVDVLADQTRRIEKRLGGLQTKRAVDFLLAKDLIHWLEIVLDYYDKTYAHSNSKRENSTCLKVPFIWTDPDVSIQKILLAKKKINNS
jgi:tRNA 2-selenouridine synthase